MLTSDPVVSPAPATDREKRLMLRAVRGSPSTVILAMILFPNLHGESDLASACGMSRKTIRKCLYDLEALGFVLRGGRYRAWVLAPGVRQMVLGEESGEGYILPIEGYILPFPRSSSSSTTCRDSSEDPQVSETTTTRADGEGYILPFPLELEAAHSMLVGMGCSPAAARAGLLKASRLGCGTEEIDRRVMGWRIYCESGRGRSVRAPGFLTAKRVGQGVDAPEAVRETRDEAAERYVLEVLNEIVQH